VFWDVNNKEWHKWCKFVSPFSYNNTQGLPVSTKDPKCPNQIFLNFDWSIYRLCVPYRGWKSDSLQLMIFVNISSTWNNFVLRNWFETWITTNVVNCVSLFYLYYLITLMAYLCSQWTPNFQIKHFMFDWSIYRPFELNSAWKRDTFQIMIFVYVCSTWNLIELKRVLRCE
jgi:hypothetical protein